MKRFHQSGFYHDALSGTLFPIGAERAKTSVTPGASSVNRFVRGVRVCSGRFECPAARETCLPLFSLFANDATRAGYLFTSLFSLFNGRSSLLFTTITSFSLICPQQQKQRSRVIYTVDF